jgi:hypothetical protein
MYQVSKFQQFHLKKHLALKRQGEQMRNDEIVSELFHSILKMLISMAGGLWFRRYSHAGLSVSVRGACATERLSRSLAKNEFIGRGVVRIFFTAITAIHMKYFMKK